MENMINFGIDLGTTNSVIAKFIKGEIQIFSSPMDFGRSTLPSVVAFKKETVIVGTKAKEYWEKKPKDVVGTFKRKMGTTESYKIACLNQSKTPIELSAYVLKELKTFVQTGETIEAAVITIPASFDTIQSNATKEAGIQAGFKQVILLQEPIAASLAYANKTKEKELTNGQWLVYDLGGGTFDVALIKIQDGEMKVLDHEGDNYLGGTDFDRLIVENIIIPHLEKVGSFNNLQSEMQSYSGKYNGKYYSCLIKAEQAKIELSAKTSTSIEIDDIKDENDDELDESITITRSEFEALIKAYIDNTIDMVKKIITRNSLTANDIQFVLMVGGSTFIPYVRSRVAEVLQIPVNCDIDPTTAVAIGAAYYAGTKQKSFEQEKSKENVAVTVKMAYQKATTDLDEIFAAKFEGNIEGFFYRITREDGGFDTGLKALKTKINEDLPLVKNSYNFFKLAIYDQQNNLIKSNAELIGIAQGKYNPTDQPLPEDICLEVDDDDNLGKTELELIFQRNSGLPTHKKLTKLLNKTVKKGSNESINIRVFEGGHNNLPEANINIGFLQIKGTDLTRDVAKGSDIEITLEMSESRELTITAYLQMTDQEFKEVFVQKLRDVHVELLINQIESLAKKLEGEIHEAEQRNETDTVKSLQNLKKKMIEMQDKSYDLAQDDVTDKPHQIEAEKRKLAQEIDNATKDKHLQIARDEYLKQEQATLEIAEEYGNEQEKEAVNNIVSQKPAFFNSNSATRIRERTEDLRSLNFMILWHTPPFLRDIFADLSQERFGEFSDYEKSEQLIKAGKFAIQMEDWDRLTEVNHSLLNLLPENKKDDAIPRPTGIRKG